MKIDLRLSEADRERYGCAEWLSVDPDVLMMSEAEVLDDADITPDTWHRALVGEPVLDDDGKPVLDDEGRPRAHRPVWFWRVIVWLALTRAQVNVGYRELDFDTRALDLRTATPDLPPGKDHDTPEPSGDSATSDSTTAST